MPLAFDTWPQTAAVTERQYGVITRRQLLTSGVSSAAVPRLVGRGMLIRLHQGVYRVRGVRWTPDGVLLAACLATGGWASHESAAWLWGLATNAPPTPCVSVVPGAKNIRPGIVVRRTSATCPAHPGQLRRIPCTSVLRTIMDFAAVASSAQLDAAVDVAVARRLVSVDEVLVEVDRAVYRHRPGTGKLRSSLRRRGCIGAPSPSVLESKVLRLLASGGVCPVACEQRVAVDGRHYRLDVTLAPGLALEVDGFGYHATPEAKRRDHERRNQLLLAGWRVLVYTWVDVVRDGERVIAEVCGALAAISAGR